MTKGRRGVRRRVHRLLRPRLYERMLVALAPEIEDPDVAGVNST
jgi:hypothetical protein